MPVGQTGPVIYGEKRDDVGRPSIRYEAMAETWPLIDDVYGGTRAMRSAGETWLPRHPKETPGKYHLRLNSTFLYNALADTIDNVVSKPFSRDVQVKEAPDDSRLAEIAGDCDRKGTPITPFAADLMKDAVKYGLVHILVDSPQVPEGASIADERAMRARPFFVAISPKDLIGWRIESGEDGIQRVTEIRYRETSIERRGAYAEVQVNRIRVYRENDWELHREVKNDEGEISYQLERAGTHTFNAGQSGPSAGVPIVTIYFEKTGEMTGSPPLEDLSWLNVEHWQSSSDQRNILRIARVGCFFAKGLSKEEYDAIDISPTNFWKSTNDKAEFGVVEHTGSAAKLGDEDLKRIEERMVTIGVQLFLRRTGTITATGSAIDAAKSDSAVKRWVRALEMGIEAAYRHAARWLKEELPDEFSVDIFSDFEISLRASGDIQSLIAMRERREISRETFLSEVKKRGLIGEAVNIDEEIERLESEPPELALMGAGKGEDDEGETNGDGDVDGGAPKVPPGGEAA